MKNLFSICLLVVVSCTGCFQSSSSQETADTSTKESAPRDSNSYQPVFGEKISQNLITNRMGQNLTLVDSKLPNIERRNFPSTGIDIYQPIDMEVSDRFTGYVNNDLGVSIVVLTNPFSMKKTTSEIVSNTVHTKNVSIIFTKEVSVDDLEGKLYLTKENFSASTICKYILSFGDDNFSWIVTATMTPALEQQFGEELLVAIQSIRPSDVPRSPPGEDVNFTMTPNKLTVTDGFVDKLVFTSGGVFPVDKVDEPIFQAGRTVFSLDVENKKSLARNLISPSAAFAHEFPSSEKEVTIDGLKGYEFIAVGKDTLSLEPLLIYSVTLFDGDDGYVMHGWVSSDRTENFIAEFRSLAKSFKRK